MVIDASGQIWGWGYIDANLLGGSQSSLPVLNPVKVTSLPANLQIKAFSSIRGAHGLALDSSGNVWSWGNNIYGQLGYGTKDVNDHPTATEVPGMSGVFAISAAGTASVAIKAGDNTVWAWGSDGAARTVSFAVNTATPTQLFLVGSAPHPRTIVFVHGINGDFRTYGPQGAAWSQLFDQLVTQFGQSNIVIEPYYQDLGYQLNGGCSSQMAPPDKQVDQLFPNTIGTPVCDSNGALAYTSTQLDDDLNGLSAPVAIIANSMGGAITRGWMTLAQCQSLTGCSSSRPPDHSLSIVDTVIFLQAAHQGSYLASNATATLRTNSPIDNSLSLQEAKAAITYYGINPSRPGVADVAGDSSWYRSVNPTSIPNLHYFNIYTDITVNVTSNLLTRTLAKVAAPFDMGDGVILPGTPTPTDHGLLGGSRFNPCAPNAVDCHEYGISKTVTIPAWQDVLGQGANTLSLYVTDPYSHTNFGNHLNDGQIFLTSCASQASATPTQEVTRILNNPANACS
jgi:pimeloyl-ACP methyl ester carboxylesterase